MEDISGYGWKGYHISKQSCFISKGRYLKFKAWFIINVYFLHDDRRIFYVLTMCNNYAM